MGTIYKYVNTNSIEYILEQKNLTFTSVACLNDFDEFSHDETIGVAEVCRQDKRDMFHDWMNQKTKATIGMSQKEMYKYYAADGNNLYLSTMRQFHFGGLQLKRKAGVLSLTKRNDNVLMWGHYADECKGMCLGFNSDSAVFQDSGYGEFKGLLDVKYSESKPNIDGDVDRGFFESALSKSIDWSYEEEVRCIRKIQDNAERQLVPIEPSVVNEIILGPRSSLANIERI